MDNRSTYNQHGQLIVIDGTAEDGTYQGDGTAAPFALFNVAEQRNIEGPFDTMAEARAALARHNPLYAQAVSRARQVENSVRFWGAQYAEHGESLGLIVTGVLNPLGAVNFPCFLPCSNVHFSLRTRSRTILSISLLLE